MINLEHITKTYGNDKTLVYAVKDVSAVIRSGSTTALCGPSGSGKSTLLNICGLLDHQYSGKLYFDGAYLKKDPMMLTQIRRQHVGFIFQRYNLIEVMSAFDNVEYPLLLSKLKTRERKHSVMQILHAVGLEGHEFKRPDQMSGGQQQRVAIARALVKRPKLVIADEPTANLDTKTATVVIEIMKNLGQELNTTFLVATHDERMLGHCDSVIRLQDGIQLSGEANEKISKSNGTGVTNANREVRMV